MNEHNPHPVAAVVLAAGAGKRFKSDLPKVLHPAAGRPLVQHVVSAVAGLNDLAKLLVVVGHGAERVVEEVSGLWPQAEFVEQTELLGTGDAVRRCRRHLSGFSGMVMVLAGDAPLITTTTLQALAERHRQSGEAVTLLTAEVDDPAGYGRVTRDEQGRCTGIVEHADATEQQRRIREVSSGIWCFEPGALLEALERMDNHNSQGEYYLPQAARLMVGSGRLATEAADPTEIQGVNDRLQLAAAARVLWDRKLRRLAAEGVTIEDFSNTYVDVGVEVGPQSVLGPMTMLQGDTRVGSGCSIGPSALLADSVVGDGAQILFCVARRVHIGSGVAVGPFTSLRPGTRLEAGSKAGSFVEIKGSTVGEGSKVPHLSYVGDAEIGRGVNLGAGTITANYDTESKVKSKTVVSDGAFTGSDTTLVAPVTVGKNAGTGAGSVVTKDVEEGQIVAGVPAKPFRKRNLEND
ncbi:MAG: bifunctional UDP-N-acetylglucosamine diphosphorylase/glucosamine-1-phosphate N-acetyltransferase GlmU [Actinomycetota bacterium]